jgi:hypothetical protein
MHVLLLLFVPSYGQHDLVWVNGLVRLRLELSSSFFAVVVLHLAVASLLS